MRRSGSPAFTLIELLVVVAIIALLTSILVPALTGARQQAKATKCLAQLAVLGQGLHMYTGEHGDVLVPGRLPKLDNCNWYAPIKGGSKYRPTFLAMMSSNVNVPPFDDPQACGNTFDRFGEKGDQQNYASPIFVCPQVPEWTDERNGSYGYNYQFLGNSRLRTADPNSFKNWPVRTSHLRHPDSTVAVADCLGTAASYPPAQREPYLDDSRDANRFGNEGFNLDPPRVDPAHGEMAGLEERHRTAADPRHRGSAAVLWVDGHSDARPLTRLGYRTLGDGTVGLDGDNSLWTGSRRDVPWTSDYRP